MAEARRKMKRKRRQRSELKSMPYEIFIGALSILSIVNLVLVYALREDEALQTVLSVMNTLFSVIFLGDFLYRLFTAPSAMRYFFRQFGWADLLASLPFPQFKILRLFRLLRVARLLLRLGPRTIWRNIARDRASSALVTLLLLGIFVLQFGSLWMLAIEDHVEGANITSASDALWYVIVTISTVGYGDQYPVTNLGRMVGAVIIIVGVGIFGTFTGYLANIFLGPGKNDDATTEDAGATDDTDTTADAVADAAARGVAAGAAAGAVSAGAAAGVDAAPDAAPAAPRTPADVARLEQLLEESEERLAEIRRLLADAQ